MAVSPITTAYKPIAAIPTDVNEVKYTAQAGISIVNDNIYCLSSKFNNDAMNPVAFHKLHGYLTEGITKSSKSVLLKIGNAPGEVARHANSLTYHDHLWYFATMNKGTNEKQVMGFDADGNITKQYTYGGKYTIGTVNYYDTKDGVLRFLISVGNSLECDFRLVKVNGTKLEEENNSSFTLEIPEDIKRVAQSSDVNVEVHGNDHYYDRSTKQLYVTKFKQVGKVIKTNWVLQYDLSGGISSLTKPLECKRELKVSASEGEDKFEIEGLCIYNDRKYVSANVVIGEEQADAVYRLYLPT